MSLKMIVQIINDRALISKAKVAARMMLKMTEINYDNFKNSVKAVREKAHTGMLRKLEN